MRRTILTLMVAATLASDVGFVVAREPATALELAVNPVPRISLPDFSVLVKQYGAPVVMIDVIQKVKAKPAGNKKDNAKGDAHESPEESGGSGFIITPDGYIITNAHVVENSADILVRLHDRKELPAHVVGMDAKTDVALLKVDAENLPTVRIGKPDELQVGEWVMAIGAPFGMDNTVTTGIVSTKARHIADAMTPFIQSSAISNPGNSGGPLFNLRGEVVGVNSRSALSIFGGNFGLSLAIPIDVVMQIAERLKKDGRAPSSRIGIVLQDVDSRLATALGLPHADGQIIVGVQRNSPAAAAGLQAGDYVVRFNETPVRSNLPFIIGMTPQGTYSTIEVVRAGRSLQLQVATKDLDSGSEKAEAASPPPPREAVVRGLILEDVKAEDLKRIDRSFALRIKKSQFKDAAAGTFLVAIGKEPFGSMDEAVRLLDTGKPIVLTLLSLSDDPIVMQRYALLK